MTALDITVPCTKHLTLATDSCTNQGREHSLHIYNHQINNTHTHEQPKQQFTAGKVTTKYQELLRAARVTFINYTCDCTSVRLSVCLSIGGSLT